MEIQSVLRDETLVAPWRAHTSRTALADAVNHTVNDDYGECVVAMHVPPIEGTAQVKFKVLDATEPTLSMPMLVANGNKVVFGGEDVTLTTAKGETAPLMNAGDDWFLKVVINNSNKFLRVELCGHHITYVHQAGFGI